jgi:membrane protein YdbS with pleckstrin-like domain
MGYVDRTLQPSEQVIFRTRLHPIVLAGAASFAAFIMLAAGLVIRHNELSSSANVQVALGGAVLAIVSLLPAWLRWQASELAVTTQRLVVRLGFRTRHTVELPVSQVRTVVVEQTASGRLLGHGIVAIRNADESAERVPNVARATELRDAILSQLPAGRGRNR